MGEIIQLHRSFYLKFLHVNSRVTVMKRSDGYLAFIVFPRAYMMNGYNNYAILGMVAADIQSACQLAATQFKIRYAPLDRHLRAIGDFNFFIQRITFRTAVERIVGGFKASYVLTRQFYGISENVDGVKWAKTKFDNKERLSTFSALFLMNYEQVLSPIHVLGFNHKFIDRILHKYNKVKVNRLKLYDDGKLIDDLEAHPERLKGHVADNREDFEIALGWEKVKKRLNKDL